VPLLAHFINNEVCYELRRFVEPVLIDNLTVLELPGTPADCMVYRHPLFAAFWAEDLLSKFCRQSFAEYAVIQVWKARGLHKKIDHPEPPTNRG
jgi:uncharacterized protein